MRKYFPWMVMLFLLIAVPALAQEAEDLKATLLPPESLVSIILALQDVPYIGPVVVWLLKAVAIVTPIFTALSICAQSILTVPQIIARFAGAVELADKIKYYSEKILYWLKMFSIFNAKKAP